MAGGDRVSSAKPRATVAEEADGALKITIPVRRRWYDWPGMVLGVFLACAFLVGAAVVLVGLAIGRVGLRGPEGSLEAEPLLLLFGFAAFGLWLAYITLWCLFGREVMLIDAKALILRWQAPLHPVEKRYVLAEVRNLRASRGVWAGYFRYASGLFLPDLFELRRGYIAFEYRGKTRSFAAALDEAEAEQIVARIIERFPSLGEERRR
jgi:hypothetical protein